MSDLQISNHNASGVNIVVSAGRSLDNDWPLNTVRELSNEMAVIPRGTIGGSNPLVHTGVTWCETALGDTWNTVLVVGADLTNTVPMDGSSVVSQRVVDSYLDGITPVADNGRAWYLAVDGKSGSWGSLKVPVDARDCPVVFANIASAWDGLVLVSVDVESTAPLVSATWGIATVVRDRGLALGAWAGRAGGPD